MGAVVQAVANIVRWFADALAAVGAWVVGWLGQILEWLVAAALWLVSGLLHIVVGLLNILVGMLPAMPSPPSGLSYVLGVAGAANQILPISEALTMAGVWGAFYSVMSLWRVITFIRGGR